MFFRQMLPTESGRTCRSDRGTVASLNKPMMCAVGKEDHQTIKQITA
jgi:hypothetical protein